MTTTRDVGEYYVSGKFVKGTSDSDKRKQAKHSVKKTQGYAASKVRHR